MAFINDISSELTPETLYSLELDRNRFGTIVMHGGGEYEVVWNAKEQLDSHGTPYNITAPPRVGSIGLPGKNHIGFRQSTSNGFEKQLAELIIETYEGCVNIASISQNDYLELLDNFIRNR